MRVFGAIALQHRCEVALSENDGSEDAKNACGCSRMFDDQLFRIVQLNEDPRDTLQIEATRFG
ncbi:hypothetical protein WM23_25450 [Burkholderia ubonensis]|nr:hypothetical protein WM23_25450 [Burkholderia ubonensis]